MLADYLKNDRGCASLLQMTSIRIGLLLTGHLSPPMRCRNETADAHLVSNSSGPTQRPTNMRSANTEGVNVGRLIDDAFRNWFEDVPLIAG